MSGPADHRLSGVNQVQTDWSNPGETLVSRILPNPKPLVKGSKVNHNYLLLAPRKIPEAQPPKK